MNYSIIKLKENTRLKNTAAEWFHKKWNIPTKAYLDSMEESFRGESVVPAWYVAVEGSQIIGGIGVIENDFHDRKDLTPNICAVYVEEEYRCQGLAGKLLETVCNDMMQNEIKMIYLVTAHAGFYERYGWELLCEVHCDGETKPSRMYRKRL